MIGLALSLFFLLLLSLSEHVSFGIAYAIATGCCNGLIAFYLGYVLRNRCRGLAFGGLLAAVYGALYGVLISEDNALLIGSLLLFGLLATAMVLTRRVDWYALAPCAE